MEERPVPIPEPGPAGGFACPSLAAWPLPGVRAGAVVSPALPFPPPPLAEVRAPHGPSLPVSGGGRGSTRRYVKPRACSPGPERGVRLGGEGAAGETGGARTGTGVVVLRGCVLNKRRCLCPQERRGDTPGPGAALKGECKLGIPWEGGNSLDSGSGGRCSLGSVEHPSLGSSPFHMLCN